MSLKTLQALLEDPQSSQRWVTLPLLEQARYMCSAAAKSLQSCPTLCNPRDSSPLGSPIPGILQARTLERVAISFSNAWKWKVKVKSLSQTLNDPMDCSLPGSSIHGIFQARVLQWVAIAFSKMCSRAKERGLRGYNTHSWSHLFAPQKGWVVISTHPSRTMTPCLPWLTDKNNPTYSPSQDHP